MQKVICLIVIGSVSMLVQAQEIPAMREEIASQIYVPSAQEQQKLSDAEFNAYRGAGLITGKRTVSETTQEAEKKKAGARRRKSATTEKKTK